METLIREEYPRLEALYRDLHSHPELSLREERTSKRMAEELEGLGLPVTRGVGGFGVVALFQNGKGPTVMIRTDMDALPITERTGLPYASAEAGAMHACGHDIHMTCLVGTARVLKSLKDKWRGTLLFIAQPAEEKGQGAEAMLKAGLFTRFPKPDCALALHVDSQLPAGKIGYASGYAFANVDSVDVTVHGRGAHGAYPQLSLDPIVMASETVLALQTIVSRELKPYEAAVVTVGSIHGGTKHNIIPDQVKLELTVRSYTEEVRNQILEAIKRIAAGIARAHNAPKDPEVQVTESIPSTYNDPELVARLVPILEKTFGAGQVVQKDPEMGGEDFGLYGTTGATPTDPGVQPPRGGRAGVPAFLFRIGSVSPKKKGPLPSLHSAEYAPDPEPTLSTGIRAMTSVVIELCGTPPRPHPVRTARGGSNPAADRRSTKPPSPQTHSCHLSFPHAFPAFWLCRD